MPGRRGGAEIPPGGSRRVPRIPTGSPPGARSGPPNRDGSRLFTSRPGSRLTVHRTTTLPSASVILSSWRPGQGAADIHQHRIRPGMWREGAARAARVSRHRHGLCSDWRHIVLGTFVGRSTKMGMSGDLTGTPRRMWLWVVAILVSLPIGGYVADLAVNGVDSVGAALAGGLIVGAVIGAAEWFALRQRISWIWIPATIAGMAVGLVAGAALVSYGIGRGDLALMGAVNGLAVGT